MVDVLGIDVGGTTVKAVRVAVDGTVLAAQSVGTPGDSDELTAAVIALATALLEETTVAVGLACPGVVDADVVHYAVNVPWRDEPVRALMQAAVSRPVVLVHDVAAAALAESAHVAGDDVLFVAAGTGIACRHVVNGVVRLGATGRAGEIGHSPVYPDGEPCLCGQRGCLEVYASAAGIARRYAVRTDTTLTAAQIASRVSSDADADAVWHEAVAALALALATDTMVSDPGVIVLGGGLADAGDTLFGPVRSALSAQLAWRPAPPVVAATLGPSAGRLGAAQAAWRVVGQLQQEGAS
jgi:glucokinase